MDTDLEHIPPPAKPCPSPIRYCYLAVAESSKGHSIVLSRQLLQDGRENDQTSEFHKYGPIAALHFLWSYFLDQKQGCADYHDMVRFSVRPWMGVLTEALHVGNSNLYAECLSFFPGTQHMKSVLPSKTVNHHKHSCLTRWSYQKSTKTVESLWKK